MRNYIKEYTYNKSYQEASMSTDNVTQRMTGMVKWFNNKSGFGFITVSGTGSFSGKDIFVHYSSIRVVNSQYKYLVQGEYVDFNLVRSENDKHEYHATDITGVSNGPILCETRRQALATQTERPGYKYSGTKRAGRDRPASPQEEAGASA
jgi:CspA family cold shock protein